MKAVADANKEKRKLDKPRSFTRVACDIEFTVTDVPASERDGKWFIWLDIAIRVEETVAMQLALYGVVTGEAFRYMRKTLEMKATELAPLLDVRAETISDWETGKFPVNRAAWGWLAARVAEKAGEGAFAIAPLTAAFLGNRPPSKITVKMLPMRPDTDVPL